jgi:hypothetical protein
VNLAAFLEARLGSPWTYWAEWHAPAGALYDAYAAEAGADPERRVMTRNEFSPAVEALGFTKTKNAGGFVFEGLTVETRAQRARRNVVATLGAPLRDQARSEHEARAHADGSYCDPWRHPIPDNVLAAIAAQVEADPARIEARIEAEYGAFLRWRPGDPDPNVAIEAARRERRMAAIPAEIAKFEAIAKGTRTSEEARYWSGRARHLRNELHELENWDAIMERFAASLERFSGRGGQAW